MGESFYCLVPWIMIGFMSISTLYLLHVILRRIIRTDRSIFISISMIYLFFALECMIDKTQGFFWFNGAAHYMIPHSIALFLTGLLIRYLTEKPSAAVGRFSRISLRRAGLLLLICIASIFVGGSNYITGLISAVLFISVLFLLLLSHKKRKQDCLLCLSFFLELPSF